MFTAAVNTIVAMKTMLQPGWIYRGEYLFRPRHNTLIYERVPRQYIILFDVMVGREAYLDPKSVVIEAKRLGLEAVPTLFVGHLDDLATLREFFDRESVLGGTKIEGIVVKNYNLFTSGKKVAMAKYVREDFREVNAENWRKENQKTKDVISGLVAKYRTEARWRKAVQHLRESGQLTESAKDIGPLMKEIGVDLHKEEADAIKDVLFRHVWPQIQRAVTRGLPEWYKESLLDNVFLKQ